MTTLTECDRSLVTGLKGQNSTESIREHLSESLKVQFRYLDRKDILSPCTSNPFFFSPPESAIPHQDPTPGVSDQCLSQQHLCGNGVAPGFPTLNRLNGKPLRLHSDDILPAHLHVTQSWDEDLPSLYGCSMTIFAVRPWAGPKSI